MKKLVILLLSIFTIGTVAVCGCDGAKTYSQDGNTDVESVQIETAEEKQPDSEESDDIKKYDKCPDGECLHPRRPHIRPNKRLPRPKSAYRKH